jgi:hypothetical protein
MKFPQQGQSPDVLLSSLKARKSDDVRWEDGRVFAYIYDAGDEAKQLLKDAFSLYLMENGLDPTSFPSCLELEKDVIGMAVDLVNGGADTIITQGAVQSNHARQTAAAGAKLGMQCELLLENRISEPGPIYLNSGNVFLDRLFGANTHHYPGGTDMNVAMEELAASLREQGRVPYVIPGGGSNRIGALGYVDCALELLQQPTSSSCRLTVLSTQPGVPAPRRGWWPACAQPMPISRCWASA